MTFGITLTLSSPGPPVVGWVLDGTKPAQFETAEEAEKAMNKLRRNTRYSWRGVRLDVAEMGETRGKQKA